MNKIPDCADVIFQFLRIMIEFFWLVVILVAVKYHWNALYSLLGLFLFLLLDDDYWGKPQDKKPRNHCKILHIVDKQQVAIANRATYNFTSDDIQSKPHPLFIALIIHKWPELIHLNGETPLWFWLYCHKSRNRFVFTVDIVLQPRFRNLENTGNPS